MKKLLLLFMLIVATLSARAQVVYLTLDHNGQMVQKTKDGKIYFAITGKVHNMKKVGTGKDGLDPTKFCVTADIGNVISSNLTVDKDTTFELRIPFNTELDTKIAITCRSKEQCNGYISGPGISPYIMAKVGFEHKLETKGMTWDAKKNKYTYTFQYKLRSSLAVKENGEPSPYYTDELQAVNPMDFDNVFSFSPANTGILYNYNNSYDGEQYNGMSNTGKPQTLSEKAFSYNPTDQTFTWTTSDKAGTLNIVDPQKYEYNTIVEATIKAYTVHLTLQKTEHKIHAEVTDIMGNKVSSGKIFYSIGFHNFNPDITQQVFYENDLSHYNRVGNITEAKDLAECAQHETVTEQEFISNFRDKEKPYYYLRADNTGEKKYSDPIDSTGVRTFNYLKPEYYTSADLTDGAADIACDMDHWRSQDYYYYFKASCSDGSYTDLTLDGNSTLCVYFWYSPDGNVKNNGSMFYAYKNMDELQSEDDKKKLEQAMDDAEKKITSGKYTLELLDGTEPEYGTYNDEDRDFYDNTGYRVTLQLKKGGTPDNVEDLANDGYVDGYTYQYEFKYKFASENADDNDLNTVNIDQYNDYYSNWLSDVDNVSKPGQSYYFLPASNANVKKFYLYSYLKLTSDDDSKEYLIAKNVYDADGVVVDEKPKVDRECSTSIRYPSYLDDDVTGSGEDRVYDDLTGLLEKKWTGGPEFKDAIKGKTWRRDECYYYQMTGGTTLSQTIKGDKLPANESEYGPNTYTLQAIVRGEKGAKIKLDLTHGDVEAHATVLGLGVDDQTHSTIDHNGCVDTIYTVLSDKELMDMGFGEDDIPRGGWQKIEATVSGESSDDLGITITSDKNFCLADVVLLLNANKTGGDTEFGHFLTTVPAIEGDSTGVYNYEDDNKLVLTGYKKFSFFDRGPNINRIVEMERGTVMNYCSGADSLYMPFNVVLPTIDDSGKKIYRLFLKDKKSYYWPEMNSLGSVECDYISYDREFTAGKPSTIALPFSVPMDVIFDWCTSKGYEAVKGKYSWTPSPADQNWGVLYNVTDDGQVQLGQTWGYNSDGTIGGTLRTPKHDSSSGNTLYYGPIMYLKTLKTGKPFMGMKSNENRPLVLYTSNRDVNNNNYPVSDDDKGGMVRCGYMTNTDIDPEGKNYADFGTHQNEEGYNFLVGSFKKIDDLAKVRNTNSFTYSENENEYECTYHFYYWSAKDYKFKKVSEGTDHKVSCQPFRAFLAIGQKTDGSNPAKESLGMRFVDFYGSGTTTGIKDITTPSARMQSAANNVYSMTGVLVRRGTSLAGLPNGLYIVNGKKVIVNHN